MRWDRIIKAVHREVEPILGKGKVASYIPALATVDPKYFALVLTTLDGKSYATGQADIPFSSQSISKVFMLTLALEAWGGRLWKRVGREPSGSSFNSIAQLEYEQGVPRNPFINAGALAVTDAVISKAGERGALDDLLTLVRRASQSDRVRINPDVAQSERQWGHRNTSLAHFMKSFGVIENDVDQVLNTYFCQCALETTATELSRAGLYLANAGKLPHSDEKITRAERATRINALMMTCGHYDMSGDFAFRVGLPGKSGVGGGILCIIPGVGSLCAWSPPLNAAGNSLAGTRALELFARRADINVFKRRMSFAPSNGGINPAN
jgi:glutaminase